jgi:hypothetical protein
MTLETSVAFESEQAVTGLRVSGYFKGANRLWHDGVQTEIAFS